MKRTILVALLLSLAGCTEEPGTDADVPDDTSTAEQNEISLPPLVLTIDDDVIVLQGDDTATITGNVTPGATVSVLYDGDLGGEATVDNGTWTIDVTVPFGHTIVEVFADDGTSTATANATVKRNMLLTVAIGHDPASGKADRSDDIYWDHGSLRSLHEDESYEGCEQPHPGEPNAHDALLDYSDITGVPITYTPCGSFGVSVDDVDDVDYGPLGWCFTVNGEAAEFGISLLQLNDGDIFAFQNCGGLF